MSHEWLLQIYDIRDAARKLTLLEFRELRYKPWRWENKIRTIQYSHKCTDEKKNLYNSQKEFIIDIPGLMM